MQGFSSIPAIDPAALAEIREMAGDDLSLVPQIIDCYLQEAPTLVAAMQIAVFQHSAENLMQAAHSLKSSSRALGAIALSDICWLLEQIGRSDEFDDRGEEVTATMAQLQTEYLRVKAALQQERDRVM